MKWCQQVRNWYDQICEAHGVPRIGVGINTGSGCPTMETGIRGERMARKFLESMNYKCLVQNFRTRRGEIDLVMRPKAEMELIFVEVKYRSDLDPDQNPMDLVKWKQRRRIGNAALDYMKELKIPSVRFRFDVVVITERYELESPLIIDHRKDVFQLPMGKEYWP